MHCDACCDNHKNDFVAAVKTVGGDEFTFFSCHITAAGDITLNYNIKGVNNDNCPCECHDLCGCCDCEL